MIFIIGYTASGKSTIGKRLANYLNLPFIDLDKQIEMVLNSSIANYFKENGEDAFRNAEHLELKKLLLTAPKNAIISCGGGTPCFHNNMNEMKANGIVIYLTTPLKKIISNLMLTNLNERPTVAKNGVINIDHIKKQLQQRQPFYLLAHVKIPLKLAKNPELLTMTLILFTNGSPTLRNLHNLF